MIKFVIARYDDDGFEEFLKPCIHDKFDYAEVFNSEANSIFEKYNIGIDKLRPHDSDIICFCHADVKILDEDFSEKVEFYFSALPNVGVAGVIGTTKLHDSGGWWLCDHLFHRGHLIQWTTKKESDKYHMIRKKGNFIDLSVVDGLCFFVRGNVANRLKFDAETYPESYDFYDLDYCLSVKEVGLKIGVIDILVEHRSNGSGIYKESWEKNKKRFFDKWAKKGVTFPS